jgi:plasmid stabilization system protein ParE
VYELSPLAAADFERLLRQSLQRFGETIAANTRAKLERAFAAIGTGRLIGHKRSEVLAERPLLFVRAHLTLPFMVAYHERTRVIVRIVDGRRDFAEIFAGTLPEEDE